MKVLLLFSVLSYVLLVTVSSVGEDQSAIEKHGRPSPPPPIPQVKGFSYSPVTGSPTKAQDCCWPCMDYCVTKPASKRMCQRVCNACCQEYKCVPGKLNVCKSWDRAVYHGQLTKCP